LTARIDNLSDDAAARDGAGDRTFRLSIVVVSYNYERFLAEAIASAVNQTYSNVEVLVVDDGSTDGSREIIRGFGGKVRAIFKPNGGEISAINRGFAEARGTAVIFLDSDDCLEVTAAEEIAAVWRPGLAKVQYGLQIIDAAGRRTGGVEPIYPPDYTQEKLRQDFAESNTYCWPPTSGNAFSRAFLDKVLPLPPQQPLFADGILNTIAPLYGDIHTVAKPLGRYRVHGRNMWALDRFDAARFETHLTRRSMEIDYLREHARERGRILSDADPLDHSLQCLRYRLCQARIATDRTLTLREKARLWRRAERCVSGLGLSWRYRILELGWFAAVAIAPRAFARRLIDLRFSPGSRPAWLKRRLENVLGARRDSRSN
jgi:glycosyltransferase involved in cell wall biosynthesis